MQLLAIPHRQAVSLLLNWFRQLAAHDRNDASDVTAFERIYQHTEEVKVMLVEALAKEREKERFVNTKKNHCTIKTCKKRFYEDDDMQRSSHNQGEKILSYV